MKKGGGLVWIAGEHNVYVDKKGKPEDALERSLPAKLAPPRSPEGTAVVLIIDKSSSMEGRKIELARLAAIGVVENLRPIDSVGVLIFDNSFQWAVPIRKAEDRATIKKLIAGITPDGGTQIAPALTEAYQRILPQTAMYKHVVLLTDGISEEGDSMTLTKEAQLNHVTISTVGLGPGCESRVPGKGRAPTPRANRTSSTTRPAWSRSCCGTSKSTPASPRSKRRSTPRWSSRPRFWKASAMESAPQLKGYVRFQSRPTSDTILMADREDPLLVRWQYGLGRAAVFTSDAKNRWAANWVSGPASTASGPTSSATCCRTPRTARPPADFDRANDELIVDYRLSRNVEEPAQPPDIFVARPERLPRSAEARQGCRGTLSRPSEHRAESGTVPHSSAGRVARVPRGGLLPPGRRDAGVRQPTINYCARSLPRPGDVTTSSPRTCFEAAGRSIPANMELWPGLLALALFLNLLELVMRKWKGLLEALHLTPLEAA